jgi:hypothetical protein
MPKHKRKHEHDHHQKKHKSGNVRNQSGKKAIHKDWRSWVAVVLMIVAIAAYVLTMDDSMWRGGQNEVPAAETGE